jgi:cysteine synthase A
MKMGTIHSLFPYDDAVCHTFQFANPREPTIFSPWCSQAGASWERAFAYSDSIRTNEKFFSDPWKTANDLLREEIEQNRHAKRTKKLPKSAHATLKWPFRTEARKRGRGPTMNVRSGFLEAIGNTPLIRLRAASDITGCDIYGKAEFLNPGGSIKDRAALAIINDAEQRGQLKPGGVIVEGTAGNVGIGIALVANARGYSSVIVMPDTQSQEKKDMLRLCGADLRLIPAVPYSNPGHYARYSGRLAEELGAFWANQFDNVANRDGHYRTTGREIWEQTDGKVDGFTCAVGSGGTLGGVARALKERNPGVKIALSDPMGAALYNWFTRGELTAEGDSITEGIGQVRVTKNLEGTHIDTAYQITDEEALPVLFDLIEHEGLVLGGSSAINIVGAMRLARDLGPGKTIVTILADGGQRYQSKLFNPDFLRKKNLPLPPWLK